jgi:hypothetical protein
MAGIKLGHQERGSPLNGGFKRPNVRLTIRPLRRGAKQETSGLVAPRSLGDMRAGAQPDRGGRTIPSDQISSDDRCAQMIGRIFSGSISCVARTGGSLQLMVLGADWPPQLTLARLRSAISACAFFRRLGELQGIFGVKTRADFSMIVSPEPANQLDHRLPSEWLFKKIQCATGLCAPSNGVFGKRRDENDWYAAASGGQAILKVKAAHTRHLHIRDQTGAVVDPRRAQEILSRFEHESDETERLQKAPHCGAN